MEDDIAYMRTHPPRCLEGTGTPPCKELESFLLGQLGQESTSFTPKCDCGSRAFAITKPKGFGPTKTTCSSCANERVLFDPAQHGYDGELGHNAGRQVDASEEHVCVKCESNTLEPAISFQYSGETDILEEDDAPDIQPEDLFGWMMIAAKCVKCGTVQEVSQDECA